jgi:alkaline phosphatase D
VSVDRRKALKLLGLGALSPAAASPISAIPAETASRFRHGVASGDPTRNRLIIWTRITPVDPVHGGVETVGWTVAEDPGFRRIAASGQALAGPDRDFTVKVDVVGLRPYQDYFYRFRAGAEDSPTGRARTLPDGPLAKAVLAFATCAHYQRGLFNAYDAIARLEHVDAVVHLGDYIYEDGEDGPGHGLDLANRLGRFVEPRHELVSLTDYRLRHALHKTDPDLQAAHARAPWICVWDDHESANDCWFGGAEGHHPNTDGDWGLRKAAAIRAYYEWMPIREPASGHAAVAINRSFQFGDLASLIMLETRLTARSHQVSYQTDAPDLATFRTRLDDPSRQMMGLAQEAWLARELEASVRAGRTWQVIGNQVVMAEVIAPDIRKLLGPVLTQAVAAILPENRREQAAKLCDLFARRVPYNLDAWDGYPAARERVYRAFAAVGARPIVVSGDSHAFWANELRDAAARHVGVELGVTSITSPGVCDMVPGLPINRFVEDANADVHFTDHGAKGFVLLTLTREEAIGELIAVSTIEARPYEPRPLKRYRITPLPGGMSPLTEI